MPRSDGTLAVTGEFLDFCDRLVLADRTLHHPFIPPKALDLVFKQAYITRCPVYNGSRSHGVRQRLHRPNQTQSDLIRLNPTQSG